MLARLTSYRIYVPLEESLVLSYVVVFRWLLVFIKTFYASFLLLIEDPDCAFELVANSYLF